MRHYFWSTTKPPPPFPITSSKRRNPLPWETYLGLMLVLEIRSPSSAFSTGIFDAPHSEARGPGARGSPFPCTGAELPQKVRAFPASIRGAPATATKVTTNRVTYCPSMIDDEILPSNGNREGIRLRRKRKINVG